MSVYATCFNPAVVLAFSVVFRSRGEVCLRGHHVCVAILVPKLVAMGCCVRLLVVSTETVNNCNQGNNGSKSECAEFAIFCETRLTVSFCSIDARPKDC